MREKAVVRSFNSAADGVLVPPARGGCCAAAEGEEFWHDHNTTQIAKLLFLQFVNQLIIPSFNHFCPSHAATF
jgi:coenzyme F420-reducing hydrogenase delta subunit